MLTRHVYTQRHNVKGKYLHKNTHTHTHLPRHTHTKIHTGNLSQIGINKKGAQMNPPRHPQLGTKTQNTKNGTIIH